MRPKRIIGVIFIAFIALTGYYGNYLPLRKAIIFKEGMPRLRDAKFVEDVEKIVASVMEAPSPIGNDTAIRFMTRIIMLSVDSGIDDQQTISGLVDLVERYYEPTLTRGKGTNFGQNLYFLAPLNGIAFRKTGDERYFKAAKKYYEWAHELGPMRPRPLYALFDIYRVEGNVEAARGAGEQILKQWPDDERIKRELAILGAER